MLRYFFRRVIALVPVVFIVSVFSFALLYMVLSDSINMKYEKWGEIPPG